MRILISGAGGFLGSKATKRLESADVESALRAVRGRPVPARVVAAAAAA